MKPVLRKGALIGAAGGALAIVVVIVMAMFGPAPVDEGERLMGASILLTRIGAPLSHVVAEFGDAVGADSSLFPLTYFLLLAAILVEWAVFGLLAAWAISRFRRG